MPGTNQLIYQDGETLYAIDPEIPDSPIEILNLNSLGVSSEQHIQASIWMPAQP